MALNDLSNTQNNADALLSGNHALPAKDIINPNIISYDAKALSEGVTITAAEIIGRDLSLPIEKNFSDPEDGDVIRVRNNIRLLVSPIEENRQQSTRYLRKMLFKNQDEGKIALISIINGLETKEDFDNFILFSIRDKKRCKTLFESDFLQNLIEGADVPELQLSEQSLRFFRHAVIAALVTKDSTIRNWVGKKARDRVVLTNAAIYQIIAATGKSNTQIINRLWYFVRDEGRLNSLMQSQILDQALGNAEAVSAAHQKAMEKIRQAVPSSDEFKALQDNNKQWKRWNKLFNVNYYNPATVITLAIELYTHLTNWFGHWWHGKAEATANHAAIHNMFPVMDAIIAQQDKIANLNEQLGQAKEQNILKQQALNELNANHQRVNKEIKELKGQAGAVEQQLGEQKIIFDQEMQVLINQKTTVEKQLLEQQKRYEDLEKSLQALKVNKSLENQKLHEGKNDIDKEAQRLQEKNKALEKELNALKATVEIVKQVHVEKGAAIDQVQLLQKEKEQLEETLREHNDNELKLQEHINLDAGHIEKLTLQLNQAKATIQALSLGMEQQEQYVKKLNNVIETNQQQTTDIKILISENEKLEKALLAAKVEVEDMQKLISDQEKENGQLRQDISNAKQTFVEASKILENKMESVVQHAGENLQKADKVRDYAQFVFDMTDMWRTKQCSAQLGIQFAEEAKKQGDISFEVMPTPERERLFGNQMNDSESELNLTPVGPLNLSSHSQTGSEGETLSPVGRLNRLSNDSTTSSNLSPNPHARSSMIPLSPVNQLNRYSTDSFNSPEQNTSNQSNALSPVGPLQHARESMEPLTPVNQLNRQSTSSVHSDGDESALSPVGRLQNDDSTALTPTQHLDDNSDDSATLTPTGQHHRTSSSELSTTAALMSLSPNNPLNGSSESALTPVPALNISNDENINSLNMQSSSSSLRKSNSQKRLSLLFQEAGDLSQAANNDQSNTAGNASKNGVTQSQRR